MLKITHFQCMCVWLQFCVLDGSSFCYCINKTLASFNKHCALLFAHVECVCVCGGGHPIHAHIHICFSHDVFHHVDFHSCLLTFSALQCGTEGELSSFSSNSSYFAPRFLDAWKAQELQSRAELQQKRAGALGAQLG